MLIIVSYSSFFCIALHCLPYILFPLQDPTEYPSASSNDDNNASLRSTDDIAARPKDNPAPSALSPPYKSTERQSEPDAIPAPATCIETLHSPTGDHVASIPLGPPLLRDSAYMDLRRQLDRERRYVLLLKSIVGHAYAKIVKMGKYLQEKCLPTQLFSIPPVLRGKNDVIRFYGYKDYLLDATAVEFEHHQAMKARLEASERENLLLRAQVNSLSKRVQNVSQVSPASPRLITEGEGGEEVDVATIINATAEVAAQAGQEAYQRIKRDFSAAALRYVNSTTVRKSVLIIARIRGRDTEDFDEESATISVLSDKPQVLCLKSQDNNVDTCGKALPAQYFRFAHVFGPAATNHEVFDMLSAFVDGVIDGASVCIFVDGYSGVGKSYMMLYGENSIALSAAEMVFDRAAQLQDTSWNFQIFCSAVEVYLKKVYDLLNPGGPVLTFQNRRGYNVLMGAREEMVTNSQGLVNLLKSTGQKRRTGSTHRNTQSSRSHAIYTIKIVRVKLSSTESLFSKITLVDLAGGERMNQALVVTETNREREERIFINDSRTAYSAELQNIGAPDKPSRTGNVVSTSISPREISGTDILKDGSYLGRSARDIKDCSHSCYESIEERPRRDRSKSKVLKGGKYDVRPHCWTNHTNTSVADIVRALFRSGRYVVKVCGVCSPLGVECYYVQNQYAEGVEVQLDTRSIPSRLTG
jgi:hypothetical protein